MHVEPLAEHVRVPVDTVEGEERNRSRMGPPHPRPMELSAEKSPDRPGEPLVEVSDQNAMAREVAAQDVLADQHPAAFDYRFLGG